MTFAEIVTHRLAAQQLSQQYHGVQKREAILEFYNSIKPKPALGYDNMIFSNGQIIGTWKRIIQPKHIDLHYKPFRTFTSLEKDEFKKIR